MSTKHSTQIIVIGGGQAGLAAGFYLTKQGADFLILDAQARTGDSWRQRWDSLHLFTPSQFDGLPGLPFPQPAYSLPGKDEVADYLEGYVRQFQLPVRHGVKVEQLERNGQGYHLTTSAGELAAQQVIVATGAYNTPHIPGFAEKLAAQIQQLHSSAYRNPQQIPGSAVLVVGAGNSGAEIAIELAQAGKRVWLAGRDVGRIPADTLGKPFGGRPYWWFLGHILSVDTPMGRRMKANVLSHGNPLIRTSLQEVSAAGVVRTPRVAGCQAAQPQLEDGRVLEVDAVVWATGFRPDFRWIDLPVFDAHGYPQHDRGVVPGAPGLYFVGLHFQRALSSALLGGVGADAAYITTRMARN